MAAHQHRYIIGVDLGGTNIVVGAMPDDGSTRHALRSQPTMSELGAEAVVARIVQRVQDVITVTMAETGARRDQFIGVGVGAPGPIDRANGIVTIAPNLGWKDFPLRDRIEAGVGLPTTLDNDANCATLGESWIGAARGGRAVVGMTIGTGIGGGLVVDGRLWHGASDLAGEIGHTTIDLHGRRCKCGNYGCLEAYASGTNIAERARERVANDGDSEILRLAGGKPERITAATVYEAARAGDDAALDVVKETAAFLGAGVANLLNTFNPDVVVIAGGVTQAGDALFEPLRAEARRRAFKSAFDACRIVPGELEGAAGVVGAVATFRQQHLTTA